MTQKLIKGISHIKIQAIKGKDGKDAILPSKDELVSLITPLIPNPVKGEKGEPGVKGDKGESVKGDKGQTGKKGNDGIGIKGDKGEKGEAGSPDTPEQVTEKINASSKKIESKQVKGLLDVIQEVDRINKNPVGVGGGKTVRYLDDGVETSAHVTELNFGTNLTLVYDGSGRLTVNATGGGGGTFLSLTDTPDTYVGQSLKGVRVNVGETALEFFTQGVGSGTVTDFIFTNGNGITGSVLTSTTIPTLSLSLGAITPTTVVASGNVSALNLSGTNTGDQTTIVGISGTKTQFDTAVSDGNFMYIGDAPTAHSHLLAAGATDVTVTATNLNILDDGLNTTLHFHDADRARANHTGSQLSTTISDFTEASQDAAGAMVDASLTYVDATPLLQRAALTGAITAAAGSNATLLGSFTTAQLNTAVSDNDVATLAGTETLTNKRISKRVVATAQAALPTINTDNTDVATITGLAQAITSMTTNLSGTPLPDDQLIVNITDNGTARAIAWGASFASGGATLPTTTVISTLLKVGFIRVGSLWTCYSSSASTASGGYSTVEDEGTPVTQRTSMNFVGAGVSVADTGGKTTVTINGGAGSFAVTETEIDFGTVGTDKPTSDKTFTITDAAITATSKIICTQSGSTATGRQSGDSLWDSISYSALAGTGSFTLYAQASGAVIGKRKLFYTFS